MKVSISRSAMDDLERIRKYYDDKGISHIGDEFVVLIVGHIETLCDHPDIGRKVREFDDEKIRELIHALFRVVYLRAQKSIHAIRVWRSERLLRLPESEV